MKIEVNILSAQIRLLQKNQKYAVRILELDIQDLINHRLSENYSENHDLIKRLNSDYY